MDRIQALLRVAERLSDGVPVDWDSEVQRDPGLEAPIRNLRAIAAVASISAPQPTMTTVSGEPSEAQKAPNNLAEAWQWGSLKVKALLGRGGFADVYRARDPALQRDVALKIPRYDRDDRTAAKRFLDEARRLARVRHENVLVVHGADAHDGRVGLWTDLIEGDTLEDCLDKQGAFGPREAALIGIDLCRALAAVHAAGLVHRDVKTGNVMRERGGRIVLMDFSTVTDRAVSADKHAPISGTPLYMPPESFEGKDAGVAGDIYALGVILYRLVSARYPVAGSSVTDLTRKHRAGAGVPLRDVRPDLPETFVRVVDRALQRDPERRYRSAGEMERDLSTVVGAIGRTSVPRRRGIGLRRGSILALAASLMVAVTATIFLVVRAPSGSVALDVESSLYRIPAGRAGVEERLATGKGVAPGDRIFLEVQGSEPLHYYVFNEDLDGRSYVLFPLPSLDARNPLAGGTTHRLPGTLDGRPFAWGVSSAGGRETIHVVASRTRLASLEEALARIPAAAPGVPVEMDAPAVETLRGIGRLESAAPRDPPPGGPPIGGLMSSLANAATAESGIWIREYRMENPGR